MLKGNGVFWAIIMCFVAVALLFWKAGDTREKTLKEGGEVVVSVAVDRVDPANNGKLVYLSSMMTTDEVLKDHDFGVSAPKVVKLRRVVEMYQWKESEEGKAYSKGWSKSTIDSDKFKAKDGHHNPAMLYGTVEQAARKVTLGVFTLSPSLVAKVNEFKPLPLADSTQVPAALKAKVKSSDGGLYIGEDPAVPQVGDLRISFEVAKPAVVSVLAGQAGDSLTPYQAKAGGELEELVAGNVPAATMIKRAHLVNKLVTVFFLSGCVIVMFVVFCTLLICG